MKRHRQPLDLDGDTVLVQHAGQAGDQCGADFFDVAVDAAVLQLVEGGEHRGGGEECTAISGPTAASYTPGYQDEGSRLRVAVTARNVEASRNGSTFMSRIRVIAPAASLVCSVASTRWPVSEAWIAICAVS